MFDHPDDGFAAFGPGDPAIPRSRADEADPPPGSETSTEAAPPSLGAADLHARIGNLGRALEMYLELAAGGAFGAGDPEPRASEPALSLGLARRIAYCRERLGQYRQAIQTLEPILVHGGRPATTDPESRVEGARAHLVLGKCYLETGRLIEAHEQAEHASREGGGLRGPEFGSAQSLLGAIAARRGEIDDARAHLRRALDAFRAIGDVPALARGYVNIGHLCRRRGEWDRALEHYQAAYYLRATEGDYAEQGAIFQHLGLVLMRVGRFEEAREKFEAALQRGAEVGDRGRILRAHLALAMLFRECADVEAARSQLEAARGATAEPPARELCLLRFEEAALALEQGDRVAAEATFAALSSEVPQLGPNGDLGVELALLAGGIARVAGRWVEAEQALEEAIRIARSDQDRHLEGVALIERARLVAATGRTEEAGRLQRALEERFERSGERPLLARLLECRGELAFERMSDASTALAAYTKARDLWRRMGVGRRELLCELEVAESLWNLGRKPEALALEAGSRARAEHSGLSSGALAARAERFAARVRRDVEASPAVGLDAELAITRLEDALRWDREPLDRLRASLRVLVEALAADGGVVACRQEANLEVLGVQSLPWLQGRRSLALDDLGVNGADLPRLLDGVETGRAGLVLGCTIFGQEHIVYLERRQPDRPPFHRSDLNYAGALIAEVSRVLPHATPDVVADGSPGARAPGELSSLRHGIYVADVITQDARMLSILSLVRKIADSDLTLLLQGETGTGKKLVAQALHRTSERRTRPFVTVDCAALPDAILESELFGHRKGAFTGAIQDRVGLLEEADGGTIFLDEIDKAGLTVQRRFLHLLDSGEIRPVGATGYRTLDVRVVCATSCPDLRTMVADGRFLKDLYYRLNDIAVQLPPLRERTDDIVLLAECFVEKCAQQIGRRLRGASAAFYERLRRHSWPGNVRELEKAMRRAVTLAEDGGWLQPALLPPAVLESSDEPGGENGRGLRQRIELFEAKVLLETLERLRWNKSRAAAELGISRKGLKGKIERYGLDRRRTRSAGSPRTRA